MHTYFSAALARNLYKMTDIPFGFLTLLGAFLFAAYLVKYAQIRHEKSLAF
jgi:hypothetical protein